MSWFLLAEASYNLSLWLRPRAADVPWRPLLGSLRLALGVAIYVPAAFALLRTSGEPRRLALVRLGALSSRPDLLRGALLVTMALAANLAWQPALTGSRLGEHVGTGWLSLGRALQPALVEEFLARGLVWALVCRSSSPWWALVWSTAVFGSWHLELGVDAAMSVMICTLPLFAGPRLLSRSIWPGAALHFLTNGGLVEPTLWAATGWCLGIYLWDRRRGVRHAASRLRPGDVAGP